MEPLDLSTLNEYSIAKFNAINESVMEIIYPKLKLKLNEKVYYCSFKKSIFIFMDLDTQGDVMATCQMQIYTSFRRNWVDWTRIEKFLLENIKLYRN
jgi:hypothetical protein